MRIAMVNITAGGMSGGYKKYLCNILPRMADNPGVDEILCLGHSSLNLADWFETRPNLYFANCDSFRILRSSINVDLWKHLGGFSPDIIFIPTERFLKFREVPVVNMVQNMEPLADVNEGNPISERVENWFRVYYAKRAVKKADRVIAISIFVKEFLVKKWNISEDKIRLIYYGIDGSKNSNAIKPSKLPTDWEGKFLFTAGSIRPARGLEDILRAMHYLSSEGEKSIRLVIAGDTVPNMAVYKNKLKRWVEKHGFADRICWAGNLGEDEMKWCYNNCSAFVMSSRVESFGQIALEAISHGCICISADNPCLPEIFKDAAVYYPPKDSQSLAKSIKSILSWNPRQKEEMAVRARNRAAMFSWDVCATKTVEELIKAYKN